MARSDGGRRASGVGSAARATLSTARAWVRRYWLAAAIGVALVGVVCSGVLVGLRGVPFAFPVGRTGPLPTATQAPRTAEPTEMQATPDPDEARGAAQGCDPQAPAPLPGVLLGGKYKGSTLPVPNEVALTFDDGPTPESTPYILDILERTHTPATFFVEGQWVTKSPDLLRREWNDGFAIGNHSWDHPMMAHLSQTELNHQFGDTQAAIQQILGPHACTWLYRPPYANYNNLVLQTAQQQGLTTITWDDGSLDWGVPRPSPQDLAHRVLVGLHPGAVILFHDGPARHPHTEQAIPLVVQGLLARGYLPVTLPRLLADMHYPGVTVAGPPPAPPVIPPDLLSA